MEIRHNYKSVCEAVAELNKRGYCNDFCILAEKDILICHTTLTIMSAEDFKIDETLHFENIPAKGDEMVIYAVSSPKYKIKGTVLNASAVRSDIENTDIEKRLKENFKS